MSAVYSRTWYDDTCVSPSGQPLSVIQKKNFDFCIIGGGLAGLSCAYHLAEMGANVTVGWVSLIPLLQRTTATAHARPARSSALGPTSDGRGPPKWNHLLFLNPSILVQDSLRFQLQDS